MNKFKIALALMLVIAPACGKRPRTKEILWNGASSDQFGRMKRLSNSVFQFSLIF